MYSSAGILSSAGYSDADAKPMNLHVIKFELRFTFIHPWLGRLKRHGKEKTPGTISLMMLSRPSSYRSCQIVPSLNSILNPCRLSYRSCQIVPSEFDPKSLSALPSIVVSSSLLLFICSLVIVRNKIRISHAHF